MVKYRESIIFVDVFCLEQKNPLVTSCWLDVRNCVKILIFSCRGLPRTSCAGFIHFGARRCGKTCLFKCGMARVLNVSSRVFWLELDDKALLDSCAMLQEGILCDVFSQKCSAAWHGARGEKLTVGIMLPGHQDADDWLNFMLSQKNLWPTFTTRGTLTEEVSEQVFSKEWRSCRPSICGCSQVAVAGVADRMYVKAPVRGLGSEARFQVKKIACFWCHGRYHE